MAEYADIIQIGARNMQNYPLLRRAGQSGKPVLLKRGMSATITEFLLAAEYLLAEGNVPVIDLQTFADGQHPFSLHNLSGVRRLADRYGVRLVLDASRIIENAWYIQRHEIGHADRTIASLVRQMAKTGHILQLDGEHTSRAEAIRWLEGRVAQGRD